MNFQAFYIIIFYILTIFSK